MPTFLEDPSFEAAGPMQGMLDRTDRSAQAAVLFEMLKKHLALPFQTQVLGLDVDVCGLHLDAADRAMVTCVRDEVPMRIPLQDLPIPTPSPRGAEWITAWRDWHARED